MKPSFFILITFLTMLAAHSAYSYSYKGGCGTQGYPSCTCTDPDCRPGIPYFDEKCMDPGTCCRVFGNIGQTPEDMHTSTYYEQYSSTSTFPPYVKPARRAYKGE
jgi:hypothetical protein